MDIDFLTENYIFIVLFIIVVFIFLVISQLLMWNFNTGTDPPKLIQEVTVETMENIEMEVNKLNITPASGFCESHLGKSADLEKSCNRLTKKRCAQTSCCVFTSNHKCSAGSVDGATYKTDKNGELITMDYYYYQDKCFGKTCPQ